MMPRVKIKCRGTPSKEKKLKLLEILFSNEIHITKVFVTNDGFALLLLNEEHVDKVFYRDVKEALVRENFTPILPPEQKVKRSVIVTRLDDVIYKDHEANDIAFEMEARNPWMEGDIEQIFMFPNSPTLKITFTQSATAKKCIERGFLAFNISVPANDIKQETFIPIRCCMRCFQLEGHTTRDCEKSRDFKLCSECSQEGHLWHQCLEEVKKCVNCKGPHSTMAMRCPKRKDIIKKKREEEQEKNRITYTGVTRANLPTANQPVYNTPVVTREEILKINICVAHARMRETDHPGSYETELNKILKLNNLPTIKVPQDTEAGITIPQVIPISTTSEARTDQMQRNSAPSSTRVEQQLPKAKPRADKHEKKEKSVSRNVIDEELENLEEQILPLLASDIGLTFYTSKDKGWPQEIFTRDILLKGVDKGIYKWTCESGTYTEIELLRRVKDKSIILDRCWSTVEGDVFRKIRSGITEERSPRDPRDPRMRKLSQ